MTILNLRNFCNVTMIIRLRYSCCIEENGRYYISFKKNYDFSYFCDIITEYAKKRLKIQEEKLDGKF